MNKTRSLTSLALALSVLMAGCSDDGSPFTEGGASSTNIISDNKFAVAASDLNPQVRDTVNLITFGGIEVTITASAGDKNNALVTSGTVYFATEYGYLSASSCNLDSTGTCSITWTSIPDFASLPSNGDLINSITAWTYGEESYFDLDGDGSFSDGDGVQITDTGEPFIDIDHDGNYLAGTDIPIHTDADGIYTVANGKFDGSNCTRSNTAECGNSQIAIYDLVELDLAIP